MGLLEPGRREVGVVGVVEEVGEVEVVVERVR